MLLMNVKSYFMTPGEIFFGMGEKIDFELPQFENLRIENEEAEFDSQFLRIFRQLKEIHKLKNQSTEFSLDCFVETFEKEISEKNKSVLIKEIEKIGFNKLRDTFEKINLECENYLCDPENIFGILKRHQFNKKLPNTDSDKLKLIIEFMHITLIHLNILHNTNHKKIPEKLISIKTDAFNTLEPFVSKIDDIFVGIIASLRKRIN